MGAEATFGERVLLVDDHELIAMSLATALHATGRRCIVCREIDAHGIAELAREHRPALAVLDLQLGDSALDGTSLVTTLRALGTPAVMLTGVRDPALLGACIAAGARGVIRKSFDFDVVVERVLDALEGRPIHTDSERADLLAAHRRQQDQIEHRTTMWRALTSRQQAVLRKLSEGLSASAIASEIHVSVATVRADIQAILRVIGVGSQLAAVARAHELGLCGRPSACAHARVADITS